MGQVELIGRASCYAPVIAALDYQFELAVSVSPVTGHGGIVEPSATFHIDVPPSLEAGAYRTRESFLVNLAPDETESVVIIVDRENAAATSSVGDSGGPCSSEDEAAFLGNPSHLEQILLSEVELQLDTGEAVKLEAFCFTLPNKSHFGSGKWDLDDPMVWLESMASNRIGGLPVLKSVTKLNLGKADSVKSAAKLRSPQVESFLSLMDELSELRDDLN